MSLRAFHGPTDWSWFTARVNAHLVSDTTGITVEQDGEIVAVCIANTWTYNSCMVHLAIDNPLVLRGSFPTALANYLFNEAKRGMVLTTIASDNHRALRLCKHLGFDEVTRIMDAVDVDIDTVLLQLRKEDCRWLTTWREAA